MVDDDRDWLGQVETAVAVVRAVRSALERRGFLEVETPILQTLAGGAAARPHAAAAPRTAASAAAMVRVLESVKVRRICHGHAGRTAV